MVDTSRFGTVAVLMGGDSAEREVSLKSGTAVCDGLCRKGVDAHPIDARGDVVARLVAERFDRAFIVLHGRGGEDGTIQGALEYAGIPYTGSGVLGSALGMDKFRCKLLWLGAALPTPDYRLITREEDAATAVDLGFPLMMKPVREGSSIGVTKVMDRDGLVDAWRAAARLDPLVLAERFVQGDEYTCAILGDRALPLIRLETPRLFYDYDAKYNLDSTRYHCPCGLPEGQERLFQEIALRAFELAGGSGWGRVDLMADGRGRPWLIEINTVPGMTDHSLVPMAARAAGIGFDELVVEILAQTLGGAR